MIDLIQGEIITKGMNYVVLQAGGIGYRLYVSSLTILALPPIKEEATLYTYLHIREDELSLYGFLDIEDKELFVTLLSVSGIGPKLALTVFSRYRAGELKKIISVGDTASLINISGIGKKTAERMVLELKDKVGKIGSDELPLSNDNAPSDIRGQAISALLALGYSLSESQKAVPHALPAGKAVTVEELIRSALKTMAKY